jgi:hypothetical protein
LQPANKKAEEASAQINNRLYAVVATCVWPDALVEHCTLAFAHGSSFVAF